MIKRVIYVSFGVLAINVFASNIDGGTAFACNKTNGCIWDSIYENDRMMRDGENDAAMRAARANVEAYQELVRMREAGEHMSAQNSEPVVRPRRR